MTRLQRWLVAWAEERLDVDLHDALEELAREREARDGARAARRWLRREIHRAALRALVSPARPARGRSWLAAVAREVRFTLRRLRHRPTYAMTFAAIVGTGIGVATFMVETRTDVLDPHAGVRVDAAGLAWAGADRVLTGIPVSGREAWIGEAGGPFVSAVVIWQAFDDLETPTGLLRVQGEHVRPGHVRALGGRIAVGRGLGAPGEILLSDRLWVERFDADPAVVGRSVRIGSRVATVVGVAEPGFHSPICCVPPQFWEVRAPDGEASFARIFLVDPSDDGAAEAWAERAIGAIPETGEPRLRHPATAAFGGEAGFVGRVLTVLLALAAVVWLTTLLTGANLIVSDALGRRREYRLRSALGARSLETWTRLASEASVLAGCSAVLAVGIAWVLSVVAPWLLPILGSSSSVRVAVGSGTLGVAAFAGGLSALAAMIPGVVVALGLSRSSDVRGAAPSSRFASTGLAVQVGLAAALIVVTGLFVTTLRTFDGDFVGFRHGATAVHFLSSQDAEGSPSAERILAEVGPGAALTAVLPVYGARFDSVSVGAGPMHRVAVETVSDRFFDLVGTRLLAGAPASTPGEAVVSRDLARAVGWGDDVVGRTLLLSDTLPLRVTGLVEAATWGTGELRPTLYRGWGEASVRSAVLLSSGDRGSVAELLGSLRPLGVALRPFETLDGLLVRSRVIEVFLARLALGFGLVSLLVAVGAVHSHFLRWVGARERDLAIRRALGAPFPHIGRGLLGGAIVLIVPGALLGIAAGMASARVLSTWLGPIPQVSAGLVAVTLLTLLSASLVALIGPLRRAKRVHPIRLLRSL